MTKSSVWFKVEGDGQTEGDRVFGYVSNEHGLADLFAESLQEEIADILKAAGSTATVKAWVE